MFDQHTIKFTTTPAKTRLTEGMVRYQGQLQHNRVLSEGETRKQFAVFVNERESVSNRFIDALGEFMRMKIAEGYRLDFGPFATYLKMRGGFPAANAPFDAAVNSIGVRITPSKAMKNAVKSLKPVNVTDAPKSRIGSLCQTEPFEAVNAIARSGTRTLVASGTCLKVHDEGEGEGVWIESDLGVKLLVGTVITTEDSYLKCTFEGDIVPGEHWLVLSSRAASCPELLHARHRITAV